MSNKILLVEDESPKASGKTGHEARVLEQHGYRIATAQGGKNAVEQVRRDFGVSLILMEIDAGRGAEVGAAAERILQFRVLPIVFLIGSAGKEEMEHIEQIPSYGTTPKDAGELIIVQAVRTAYRLFTAHEQQDISADEMSNRKEIENELRASEEHARRRLENIDFLADTALDFIDSGFEENIYSYIGRRLFELNPSAYIIVNSVYQELGLLTTEALFGADPYIEKVVSVLGFNPVGRSYSYDSKLYGLATGKVEYYGGGLYELTFGEVPRPLCRIVETMLNLQRVYMMAFIVDNEIYASATMIFPGTADIYNVETVETFIKQASIALKRQKIERQLQRSEEQYRLLAEHSTDGIASFDKEFKPLYLSPSVEDLTGYSIGELTQSRIFDLVHPDDQPPLAKRFQSNIANRVTHSRSSFRIFTKQQEVKWVELSAKLLFGESGELERLIVIGRDITERKRVEIEIEERKRYAEAILRATPNVVLTLDTNKRIREWNYSAERLFHYSEDEVIGRELDSLVDGGDEDTYRKAAAFTDTVAAGTSVPPTETVRYTKEGNAVNVIVAGSPIMVHGSFEGIVATYTDITELKRKESEVESLLYEKEQLLKEVHHRIKNHMYTIASIVSLRNSYTEDSEIKEVLEEIQNKIRLMQNIYQTLYTGESVGTLRVRSFLEQLIHDIKSTYLPDHSITIDCYIEDIEVSSKKSLPIGIIITELITNSIKYAFPQGREGTIAISIRKQDPETIEIRVADDGVGLPDEVVEEENDGFGLTLVRGYIRQFDGKMSIENDIGTVIKASLSLE
ncbi:MAG: PAS domain S-box protein [Spirochaetia bacterium]